MPKGRFRLHSQHIRRFVGNKQHHKIQGTVTPIAIIPGRQFVYVFPYRQQMGLQGNFPFRFGLCIAIIDVGGQRNFRIDNHLPVIRIHHNHIRPHRVPVLCPDHPIAFIFQRFLNKILPSFRQSRIFKNSLENHFPPIPLRFRISFQSIG